MGRSTDRPSSAVRVLEPDSRPSAPRSRSGACGSRTAGRPTARRATSCPRACRPRGTSSGRRGRAAPRRAPQSRRETGSFAIRRRRPCAWGDPILAGMATTTLTEREERIKEQRRSLPDSPGVYLFRDSRKRRASTSARRSRSRSASAGHFSKASSSRSDMVGVDREHRVRRHADRGRGAARRAELHQAVPADLQRPAARRQVVPVHRDLAGREVPARLLHAREAPARPRVLRPVLEREEGARDARPARQGVPAPQLRRGGAGPGVRQPVPRLLHQALRGALRGLRVRGGVPRGDRQGRRLPVRPLPPDRARPRGRDEARRRRAQEFETAAAHPQQAEGGAQPARAPADLERVGRLARRDRRGDRGDRRERAGLPGARRRAGRPPELLPRQRGDARRGRGRRGVRAPVLRHLAGDPAAGRRASARCRTRACWPRRSPSGAAARSRCATPSAATSAGSSSSPSATRGSRSTRTGCAPSTAGSSGSTRSRGSSASSGCRRSRCGSSASTSRTSARRTPSRRWSCSRAARRRSPTTAGSASARPSQDDFAAMNEVLSPAHGAVRGPARALAARGVLRRELRGDARR